MADPEALHQAEHQYPSPQLADTFEDNYWVQLVQYSKQIGQQEPLFAQYATLQRLNLLHIQNTLAKLKADMWQTNTTSEVKMVYLRDVMHSYTTAIRDFEYMHELGRVDPIKAGENRMSVEGAFPEIAQKAGAPYNTTYLRLGLEPVQSKDAIRELLRQHLYRGLSWSAEEKNARKDDYYQGEPPKMYSPFLDRLARFIIGVGGGLSLTVPMLVMSFDASRTKSLITVSVAVVLFSLFISLGFKTDNPTTLIATATYAAVLVVFVGTSVAGS